LVLKIGVENWGVGVNSWGGMELSKTDLKIPYGTLEK
jgi:hypothetical protein